MRNAFADAVTELAREDERIILLSGDIGNKLFDRLKDIGERHFLNCGIAEANMVGIAGGLALAGKLPFASSFAVFLCDKGYDQLRMCVAYPGVNAKFVGSHGGISIGEDGPSQQSVEDDCLPQADQRHAGLPGSVQETPLESGPEGSRGRVIHEGRASRAPLTRLSTRRPRSLPRSPSCLRVTRPRSTACRMARQLDLHLISKLRSDAALYAEMSVAQRHAQSRRKYGERIDLDALPAAWLRSSRTEDRI